MTKKKGMRPPAQFKTLEDLFAAVREACAAEWERNFGYRPDAEEIASWCKWAVPHDNDWWGSRKNPSAPELEARAIYKDIASALDRLRALSDEKERAVGKRFALLEVAKQNATKPPKVIDEIDAALTERERGLVYCKIVAKLNAWVGGAEREEEKRVRKTFDETGLRFKPTFRHQPWVDVDDPPVRLQVALEVLTISPWSATPETATWERWVPEVRLQRTDRQAALMSLLSGTRPSETKRTDSVRKVLLGETKAMRLKIRRARDRVTEALIALQGEPELAVDGEPLFGNSEEVSRLMNRPTTHESAMYASVALVKNGELYASMIAQMPSDLRTVVEQMADEARAVRDAHRKRMGDSFLEFELGDDGEVKLKE